MHHLKPYAFNILISLAVLVTLGLTAYNTYRIHVVYNFFEDGYYVNSVIEILQQAIQASQQAQQQGSTVPVLP